MKDPASQPNSAVLYALAYPAGKGVAISTPEPERADSAELVDAIPAQTAWETRIATLTENLKDALCEAARLRSQKSVLELAMEEARQQTQAKVEAAQQQTAVAKVRMRVAEETVHDVTARLRNTQTRVAELSTALGAAKRANHTLTEKNARLVKEIERLQELVSRLTHGQPAAAAAATAADSTGSSPEAFTPANSLQDACGAAAENAELVAAGATWQQSAVAAATADGDDGGADAAAHAALPRPFQHCVTKTASASIAVDPELAAQLIAECGEIVEGHSWRVDSSRGGSSDTSDTLLPQPSTNSHASNTSNPTGLSTHNSVSSHTSIPLSLTFSSSESGASVTIPEETESALQSSADSSPAKPVVCVDVGAVVGVGKGESVCVSVGQGEKAVVAGKKKVPSPPPSADGGEVARAGMGKSPRRAAAKVKPSAVAVGVDAATVTPREPLVAIAAGGGGSVVVTPAGSLDAPATPAQPLAQLPAGPMSKQGSDAGSYVSCNEAVCVRGNGRAADAAQAARAALALSPTVTVPTGSGPTLKTVATHTITAATHTTTTITRPVQPEPHTMAPTPNVVTGKNMHMPLMAGERSSSSGGNSPSDIQIQIQKVSAAKDIQKTGAKDSAAGAGPVSGGAGSGSKERHNGKRWTWLKCFSTNAGAQQATGGAKAEQPTQGLLPAHALRSPPRIDASPFPGLM